MNEQQLTEPGTAVWAVAVGIIVAGRVLGPGKLYPDDDQDRIVIDQCTLGQHLPQYYQRADLHVLQASDCAQLGLCQPCLGYGTVGELVAGLNDYYPYAVDEVPDPCGTCGGSGREYVHVTIDRHAGQTIGRMTLAPHDPVYWAPGLNPDVALPTDVCVICGITDDIHPAPAPPEDGG